MSDKKESPMTDIDDAEQRGFIRGRDVTMNGISVLAKNLAASLAEAEEAHKRAKRLLDSFSIFISCMEDDLRKEAKRIAHD